MDIVKYVAAEIKTAEIENQACIGGNCPLTKTAAVGEDEVGNMLDEIKQKKGHAYLHVIAMGAGDYYGCFTENNWIITSNGTVKKISELSSSDAVMTHNSKSENINDPIIKEWKGDFFTIQGSGLPKIESTSNHKFQILRQENKNNPSDIEWVEAQDLNVGDYLTIPRESIGESDKANIIPLHIDYAVILGLFITKGDYDSISYKSKTLRFEFYDHEQILIDRIKKFALDFGVKPVVTFEDNKTKITMSSCYIASFIEQHISVDEACYCLSPEIFNQRDDFIANLFANLIDGVGRNKGVNENVVLKIDSFKFLMQLKQLLYRLGVYNEHFWEKEDELHGNGTLTIPCKEIVKIIKSKSHKAKNWEVQCLKEGILPSFKDELYMYIPVTGIDVESNKKKVVYDANLQYNHSYPVGFAMAHNSNNNGDFFREKDLIDYYKTFETAGIFTQHFNKDPSKSNGKVRIAKYNYKMKRVELLLDIDSKISEESLNIYNRIKSGDRIAVSMGVKVPSEACSYCGAVTKGNIANRCEHLKFMMHRQMPNGQVVYAINMPPMNFFDISIVVKPADAQGHTLFQKVASDQRLMPIGTKELQIGQKGDEKMVEKIATLIKRFDAIDALPAGVDEEELNSFREAIPEPHRTKLIISKKIILRPSEAIFLGSDLPKEQFKECSSVCDNVGFLKALMEKMINRSSMEDSYLAENRDLAEHFSNPLIDKLQSRTFIIKQAAVSDYYRFERANQARPHLQSRKKISSKGYPQYKINYIDGKSTTIGSLGFGLQDSLSEYYLDLVDSGYANNIMAIMTNGNEKLLYERNK